MTSRIRAYGGMFCVVLGFTALNLSAQNFPFPQHVSYVAGIKPNGVSQSSMDNTVSNYWFTWKSRYIKASASGGNYVYYTFETPSDPAASVSEGHGYGMVLSAYMAGADSNAKSVFDGLYTFYKNHPSQNNAKLMAWQQDKNGNNINGADSATDGDMDIAYGLLLADKQWGSAGTINYFREATNMIYAIMQSEVNQSQWTLRLGDWATSGSAGGFSFSTATRPSDFMFDHLRSYLEATGDGRWTNVINKTFTIVNTLFNNNSPSTGLIPDFVVLNGSTYQPAPANFLEGADDGKYSYNSCRTPWRFATDYLLRGTSPILAEMRKLNGWIKGKTGSDPNQVFPGYSLSGTALDSSYTDSSFTSPFGVSAMTDSTNQTWLNSEWSWNASRGINADDAYFGNSIKMHCVIVMSGNWWRPVYGAPAADFSVSAAPGSQGVNAGDSTTYTVTISAINGFTGTVNLGASGLPAGASASFSPVSVTGSGTSTMTVTTSTSTPPNTATLTITGTSGSLSHSTTVSLAVRNFSLSATPASQTVTAGNSTTFTAMVGTINGFNSTVAFSVSGLPAGASGSFVPPSVGGFGSSTLTVTTTTNTPIGPSTLTITGTSGGLTQSTNVTLTVSAASGGLPAGWTDADIGAVGVPGSASFNAGTFSVDGSGADIWGTADEFHFAHEAGSGDFTFTARVATQENTGAWAKCGVMIRETIAAGSAHVALYITPSNGVSMQLRPSTGAASLDVARNTGLVAPQWLRLVRSGNTFTGFRSADGTTWVQVAATNVTMASNVRAGLAVCAHNDATLNSTTFNNVSLTTPAPDFSISATPASRTVTVGNGTTYTVNIGAINGFSGSVDLSASGLPAGASANFNPAAVSGAGASTMTVTTAANTPVGTNTITITGTSGSLTHSATVALVTVAAPVPDFSISATPASRTVTAGSNTTYTVTVTATNGFSGSVDLSAAGLPSGAGASFNPAAVSGSGSSTLTVTTATNTPVGTDTLTIAGTSGTLTHNTTVSLIVNSAASGLLLEAESLSIVSNGAGTVLQADVAASGGQWISFNADGVNDYIEFTLPNVSAGTYDLALLYKQHPNRGTLALTVDGVAIDGTLDEYSASPSFVEKDFGTITFVTTGNHAVRLTVAGKNAASTVYTLSADAFRLTPAAQAWSHQDIGAVGVGGSFSQNSGTYTVAGSGADIWTTADQFHFAYQPVSGNITITARVASETGTASFAKAGVMLRASLATNSVHAAVLLTPTNGVSLHIRPSTGAASINVGGWVTGPVPPHWVRLVRSGNTFTGFASPDGSTWTQVGSTNVTMSAGAEAGMAVSAHNNAALNTAVFDNVNVQ